MGGLPAFDTGSAGVGSGQGLRLDAMLDHELEQQLHWQINKKLRC
jgi:hypothetical protein